MLRITIFQSQFHNCTGCTCFVVRFLLSLRSCPIWEYECTEQSILNPLNREIRRIKMQNVVEFCVLTRITVIQHLKHASKRLKTALLTDILEYRQSNTFLVTGKRIIISLIFPCYHYVLSSSSVFIYFFCRKSTVLRGFLFNKSPSRTTDLCWICFCR